MLEKLFSSKLRYKVIDYFLQNPKKEVYPGFLGKKLNEDAANISRELRRLKGMGFLNVTTKYKKTIYTVNVKNSLFPHLSNLFKHGSKAGKEIWFVMEEVKSGTNPTLTVSYMNSVYVEKFFKDLGLKVTPKKYLTIFSRGGYKICFPRESYRAASQEMLKLILADPEKGNALNQELLKKSDIFFDFAEEVMKKNLSKLSGDELIGLLEEFYDKQTQMHTRGWVGNVVDFVDAAFSKHLLQYLEKRIKGTKSKLKKGESFSALTTPLEKSFAQKEYESYLEIVKEIQENPELKGLFQDEDARFILERLPEKIQKLFKEQEECFGWIGYGVEGPGWKQDYYVGLVASLVRQNIDPEELLAKAQANEKDTKTLQEKYIGELSVDEHYQKIFEVARGVVFTKGYRKDVLFHGLWCLEYLLREFARRTNIALRQVRYIHPWEYRGALSKKEKFAEELNRRWEFCAYYSEDGRQQILSGKEAQKFIDALEFEVERIRQVKRLEGDCASPGKVRGVVAIINTPSENEKIEKADILVSAMTNPDLMPAIRKSKAIVTDIGGLTCHAAIVSREFGIPCVVGTRIATQILKDGSVVEVDATHGVVIIIKK